MDKKINIFTKYLTLWVMFCIVVGILIGYFIPVIPQLVEKLNLYNINLLIVVLIWLMIYPMMLKVDFKSILNIRKRPKGLIVTFIVNWLIKPFSMYLIAYFFINIVFKNFISNSVGAEYIAGAILLGAAPCTAMVFVWSSLADGDPNYTIVQVALNDLIILFAFTPIVSFLLGISKVPIPIETLLLSVLLFVVIPLSGGMVSRIIILRNKDLFWFKEKYCAKFHGITEIGLLFTLVLIFSFQGDIILSNPFIILLLSIPLLVQTYTIYFIGFGISKVLKIPYEISAPSSLIGASNFFELAVAVSISLFGLSSGATLMTVIGVLVEVPVMLSLVKFSLRMKNTYIANR